MSDSSPPMRHTISLKSGSGGASSVEQADSNSASQNALDDRSSYLLRQLGRIPKDAQSLLISDDAPKDHEWITLGSHFTSVQDLELDAGFNEYLNDRLIPLHWPLDRLLIASSCGEVSQSPHILLGKVKHLIFLLTMGIRFEGPTSSQLSAAHHEAVERHEKEDHYVSENGFKVTYLPLLARQWKGAKYSSTGLQLPASSFEVNPDLNIDPEALSGNDTAEQRSIGLTKLEILENNAVETYIQFSTALPQLTYNLRLLNIRSTNCCDLNNEPEELFGPMLASMDRLETLVLTLGEVFDDDDLDKTILPTLYRSFPPNVRTLRFRGPGSLTKSNNWGEWIVAFGDPTFLPALERLSFVCDLAYNPIRQGGCLKTRRSLEEHEISEARIECNRLLDAARSRTGDTAIEIEPFVEKWNVYHSSFDPIDERWQALESA